MSRQLKVGIVGTGIGRLHAEGFQALPDLYDVVAVCDLFEDRARALAETCHIPQVAADFEALCRMDDLDVIDLCTPPDSHEAHIRQALASGKHVICEKPVAGSLQTMDSLIQLEATSSKRVMPIFQYRFGHGIQKLKLLKESGLTGRAYLTTVETAWRRRMAYYDQGPWRKKWKTGLGGVLVIQALHAHDLLYYILGPAKRVSAWMNTSVNDIEVEDCVVASMEMADGSLASLAATLGSSAEITRHRFCFAGLTAESNTAQYANASDPWTFTGDMPEIDRQIVDTLAHFVPLPEGFAGQFSRFCHSLQEGIDPPVTLADARASVEMLTALYHAAQTGQPVELPIGVDHPKYAGWLPKTA